MAAEPPIVYRKPEGFEVAGEFAQQKSRQRQGKIRRQSRHHLALTTQGWPMHSNLRR